MSGKRRDSKNRILRNGDSDAQNNYASVQIH